MYIYIYILYVYIYIYVNNIHQNRTSDPIYMILIFISHVPCMAGHSQLVSHLFHLAEEIHQGRLLDLCLFKGDFSVDDSRGSNDGFRRRK